MAENEAPADNKEGTPLPMPDVPEWQNKVTLVEPGVKDEEGNDSRAEEKEEAEDGQGAETVEIDETVEIEETPPANLLDDPGEFKPTDLSFEVVTYDEEGKNAKVVKVKSVDQWDELVAQLENDNRNFGSAAGLIKAQRQASKMESDTEREQRDWQAKKDAFDAQQEAVAQQAEALNTMVSEVNYLISKGDLPPVAKEYVDADWSDENVAKQSGVKEQLELLSYMKRENGRRTKAGLKPMTSLIDGFNALQLDQSRKQQSTNKQRVAEARREVGGKVVGSTPNPTTMAPKGIAVGRTGRLSDMDSLGWGR